MDLAERLNLFEAAIEHSGHGVLILTDGPSGPTVHYANQAFSDLLGTRPGALRGRAITDLPLGNLCTNRWCLCGTAKGPDARRNSQ